MGDVYQREPDTWSKVPHWLIESQVGDGPVRLYALMGKYADRNGEGYPSLGRLAEELGRNRKTIRNWVKQLQAVGAVDVYPRTTDDGDADSNLYHLHVTAPDQRRGGESTTPTPESTFQGGESTTPTGRESTTPTGRGSRTPLTRSTLNQTHRNQIDSDPESDVQVDPPTDEPPLVLDHGRSDPDTGLYRWVDADGKVRQTVDELWDAASEIWGEPLTGAERGKRNREIKQLREAGIRPDQLAPIVEKAIVRWGGNARPGLAGIVRNLGDLLNGFEMPSRRQLSRLEARSEREELRERIKRRAL